MMMNTQKDELTTNINIKLTMLNLITLQDKRCRSALPSHFSCELPKYRAFTPETTSCNKSPFSPFLYTILHTSQDGGSNPTNKVNITNVYVCDCVAYLEVSAKSCKTGRPSRVGRHIAPRHTSLPPGRFQRIRRDIQSLVHEQ